VVKSKRLLIIVPVVVLGLILVILFMPAQRVSIEGVGKVSFETTVTLSVGSEVAYAAPDTATNSPTTNTGTAWTDPTNAYADGTNAATITSGAPSGNNVWGDYGFSLTGATITQVRVRYDAWSVGDTIVNTVAYNAVTRGTSSLEATTLTFAHNVGNQTNKVLIVGVSYENSASPVKSVSGVTYNGAAMTLIAKQTTGGTTIMEVSLWYLLDASLPNDNVNHNVVVTVPTGTGNAIVAGAISLYNANQAAPTNFGGSGDATDPVTKQYTTTVNNTMAVDVAGCGNSGSYTATGQTERYDAASASTATGAGGTRLVATAGTVTNSWNYSSTVNRQAMLVCGVQSYTYQSSFEQIRVDVSWDGGSSWSNKATTTTTALEATYWYDVTAAPPGGWTPAKLANGQLQVRADAVTVGSASTVSLDWLPVEVTYTPAVPDISVDPTTYYFGTVTESSTPSTITTYFTITNASTIQTDQTIGVTTNTWSGGIAWSHNDSGSPGANAAALLANRGGSWGIGDIIVKYSSPVYIYENCPASTNYSFGLKLLAPTSFSDGVQKQIVVRITAVAG